MSDLVREQRLRRASHRQCVQVVKSRRRDSGAPGFGLFYLTDAVTGAVIGPQDGVTLDGLEAWLAAGGYAARNGASGP